MEYKDIVKDFRLRTLHNLEIVEGQADQAYEVTQLVNSLLGLIVLPRERGALPDTPLNEIEGFPALDFQSAQRLQVSMPLSGFWRFLRNAVAHFDMEFVAESGVITGLVLSNHHRARTQGPLELSLAELRELVVFLVDLTPRAGDAEVGEAQGELI